MARTSPAGLALATSNGRWRLTRHLDAIDGLIVDAVAGDAPDRLIISVPPRHGKSELISRHTPPWYLGNFPDRRVMLASYEARFAESWGRKGRDLLEAHGQQLYGVRVRPDARAAAAWDIDGHEGGMVTGGVGGPFTGKGADLLIIDDPVKNAEEADSETIRDKHWDWWQSTASTRLHPGAVVIVVMTRWHEDDLAGRLLAGLDDEDERGAEWHEVRFPALAEAGDVLGREEGQALWPERFDEAWMARKKREVGSRWFNALYQGRPTAEEGDIFKRQWWRFYPPADDVPLDQTMEPKRVWTTWDTALKDKTQSDYSVGIAWAQDGPNRYLLRVVRGRWGFTEVLAQMTALAAWLGERWPGLTASHYVEAAAMGPELMAAARQRIPGVAAMTASVDKVARAYAVTPFLEGGNVFLPGYRAANGRGYDPARTPAVVQDLIEECSAFPNGAHDDQVDALVYGIDPRRWVSGARRSRNEVAEERRRRNRPITGGLGGDY